MDDLPSPDDLSRFDGFTILTTTYKTVAGHAIATDVLVPKSLTASASPAPAKPSPIILRYHGGGFITASTLYPGFFQLWYLELAARHSAIIVTPNYRLAPEASMDDIFEDIEDHWAWMRRELPAFVREATGGRVSVDLSRVLTAGDSAGGYLGIMMGLTHADEVRAVTAAYPCVDMADDHFTKGTAKPPFGMDTPRGVLDEHYEKMRRGEVPAVVSEDAGLARGALMLAAIQHGGFARLFPLAKRHLFPLERLRDGARFPRGGVFVWHGQQDSVVPVGGALRLEKVVREVDPELDFRLTLRDGEHGFDQHAKLDDAWLEEGLRGPVRAWLE
ncbi:Putative alpha/beta hydrolase-3 [Colletotrichum destructivum]|uniref:Alpha/beta hydrolase-3 n=1 Tax=Colletotrichum destructivum TaxID=34406 RepID=A0AAX4J1N1_9PEZI|nr:Putative alpha/beta hydrolase-3 [Colletotrichum destructivum]